MSRLAPDPEETAEFGSDSPMKRAAQPCEMAPAYVYFASTDSSYVAGEVLLQVGDGASVPKLTNDGDN